MADIITPILNIISVLCSCSANNRCCYLLNLQENKEDLNNALVELRATRDGVNIRVEEAENNPNQKRTPQVDSWLQRVQTVDAEVVQVIQNADQEIEGRCFGGNCTINCWSARKIGKLVLRKLPIVNDLKSKGDLFVDVAYKLPPPLVQEEPMDSTVGMESMFDKVWSLLAKDEVRIMGLYGYGGVGKTTLLKQINNEFLKTTSSSSSGSRLNGFDVVILVVVSQALNIDAIQKEIGKRLGLSSTEADKTSIFNALSKKNFVLLLDDLWEGVDLQSIGIPPPLENKKSKVIFTTRSEIVCGHMDANIKFRVECLPWDKAWTLFQEKVGNETLNSHPDVPELAKVVARECDGLPLALITIGRAMSTKKTVQEWNHAITTLRRAASEFPGMGEPVFPKGNAVFPVLKVSYDSLGNDRIKSCFLYCALFPEDHFIDIQSLVDYWICEGFISLSDFNHIDEARNYGYDVIGDLKGACLLESGRYEETGVKMHDTIRDMALWITRECGSSKRDKLLIISAFDGTSERLWYNAERIYFMSFRIDDETKVPTLKSPNLHTLIYRWGSPTFLLSHRFFLPQNFFEYMPHLRVLDLTECGMETFPTSITGLLELRYLSLSNTDIKELPEELGKLVKLNYLNLSNMYYLRTIPSGVIGSLLELRVLNLYGCRVVDWDLEEVYKLKHLNDFEITIRTQHNLNKLLSNKNLQMCTTHLFLYELEFGIEQQQHLDFSCFQKLTQIQISVCNGFKDLTWVGYVPNLKTLEVGYCKELEEIVIVVVDGTILRRKVDIFKSLKDLQLDSLPKLKSICSHPLVFPCLESMTVSKCPRLNLNYLNELELRVLNLHGCYNGPDWDFESTRVYKLKHLNDFGITIRTQHNLNKLLSLNSRHLGSSCFQKLTQIQIIGCNGFKDLTWVGYVPKLKRLEVYDCKELEEIVIVVDDDFGGSTGGGGGVDEIILTRKVDIFKSLTHLRLWSLPKLKSICSHPLVFPCFEELIVSDCRQLKKLPFDSGSNVNNTLLEIAGGPKWWSELQWEEDHNNNNELLKSKFLPYFEKFKSKCLPYFKDE